MTTSMEFDPFAFDPTNLGYDMQSMIIFSGHFNPFHNGHLDMLEAAAEKGPVTVIVNNDKQQLRKKGKIIMPQEVRLRLVKALRLVDDAMVAIDKDQSISASLALLREDNPDRKMIFANGGDRSDVNNVPELAICTSENIHMWFGAGGEDKVTSSSEINRLNGTDA